jgi:hypothetical protein
MVTIEQADGTVKTFGVETFWLGLFHAASTVATGETPTGPVADAVNNATRKELERLERLAASGALGAFLKGTGAEGEKRLLEVSDSTEDLSEPA